MTPYGSVSAALLMAALSAPMRSTAAAQPVPPPATTLPTSRPATIAQLAAAAEDRNPAVAWPAIRQLAALGPRADSALRKADRLMLARDKQAVEEAIKRPVDPARVAAMEWQVQAIRSAAFENLRKLGQGDSVQMARQHYDALLDVFRELGPVYARRAMVIDVMYRRLDLKGLLRSRGMGIPLTDKDEALLLERAERFLDCPLGEIAPANPDARPPKGPQAPLWFYRVSRAIEAFNATLAPQIDRGELDSVLCLNRYREALGLMPLEIDLRLAQSARRHSREMVELGYFSHDSPTDANKTPWKRMAQTGYDAGAAENIAMGQKTGEAAFWTWFNSPPHHQNLVTPDLTAIGVGRWNKHWTQNFGRGKRLMLLPPEQLIRVEIRGQFLPPQEPP